MAAGTGVGDCGAIVGEPGTKSSCQWTERYFYFHSCCCAGSCFSVVALASGFCGCFAGISQDLSLCAKPLAAELRDAARPNGAGKRRRTMASIGMAYCSDCITAAY